MTRRIGTIRETITANVPTPAHPAIGWACLSFVPKRGVFCQFSDDTFKLKDGETWNKTIVGKLTKDTPFWDKGKTSPTDCRMCRRWHIRGHCFSDCPNTASHVPKDSIPSDRKEAMKGYLAKVRKS